MTFTGQEFGLDYKVKGGKDSGHKHRKSNDKNDCPG